MAVAPDVTARADIEVKEIAVAIPPTVAGTITDSGPIPQADQDEVVADQLVAPDRVESEVVEATDFQTIGVTWPAEADGDGLGGQVRTRTDGEWSAWIDLETADDAPDAGTADAEHAPRGGTDPVSIGDVDAVQLAFAATDAGSPDGLNLTLIGSELEATPDAIVGVAPAASRSGSGQAIVRSASLSTRLTTASPAPRVISRAEWGAPSQRCTPDVATELVGAVVHHTAGSNNYTNAAEAMQQLRNDAAYHINGRGWCDLGYNFVVDKFGNIYEGRANSLTQPVIGVHAGGFNTGTVGVSMLGTYDSPPSAATQQAVAQIIGWRLGSYGLSPQGTMSYSTGAGDNARFQNQTVSLPRIFGHRDTAYTACPGAGGYSALPAIRSLAASAAAAAPLSNALPIGAVDAVVANETSVTVSGWTLDPDTSSSNDVHIYIDGVGVALTATLSRPDVAAVFGKGDKHGFTHTKPLPAGPHAVCVFSIDTEGGTHTLLSCRTVAVGSLAPPIGSLESVTVTNTAVAVSGWTLDPDTSESNDVHVYIDGVGTSLVANASRPDVRAAYGRGDLHGFSRAFPATPGRHEICVFGINTSAGANITLGCRSVVVPDAVPIGRVDAMVAGAGTLTISGWTLDPDTTASNDVHIYIDGVGVPLIADQSRPDVAAVYKLGDKHGFTHRASVPRGLRSVCVFGINTSQGAHTLLSCRNVLVP